MGAKSLWRAWNGELNFEKYFSRREKLEKTSNPVLKLWYRHYIVRTNNRFCAFLPPALHIPRSVVFPHGISGVYISQGAKIGENCVIFHHVTIGSNTLEGSRRQGSPVLEDNVFVGAGAKIIGGITVGAGSRIAAGCALSEDVPAGSTVSPGHPVIKPGDPDRENLFRGPDGKVVRGGGHG